MTQPPRRYAVLTGTLLRPAIELGFEVADTLPDGTALLSWVRGLSDREWDRPRGLWRIYGFGTAPQGALARAGFEVVGPDGTLTDLTGYIRPVAVPSAVQPGMCEVYHRLAGSSAIRGHVGPDAEWFRSRGCWLVRRQVLTAGGHLVRWCDVDPRIVRGGFADPGTLTASTRNVLDGVRVASVTTAAPAGAGPHAPTPVPEGLGRRAEAGGLASGGGALSMRPPDGLARLVYDGTVDGLRGVPVVDLCNVAASCAASMHAVGIRNVYDLLHHVPRSYIDLTSPGTVRQAVTGDTVSVLGTVTKVTVPDVRGGMAKATVKDREGTLLYARWFNARWVARRLAVGATVLLNGRLERFATESGFTAAAMTNPLLDVVTPDKSTGMIGIYPASGKHELSTWQLFHGANEAVHRLGPVADPVPITFLASHGLPGRADAFRFVHDPASPAQARAGRDRLAYDELLRLQLSLLTERAAQRQEAAIAHRPTGALTRQVEAGLRFDLTAAQRRALTQIVTDMRAGHAMHRLLQGDVGSGKTICSLIPMLVAAESGHQAALVAPTAILASQHFEEARSRLSRVVHPDGRPVTVALLTNKVTGKHRRQVLDGLATGAVDVVVGTHALFADAVRFHSLGLVVVDEQHRFGTKQRRALRDKGVATAGGRAALPDVLYATATPIPRTAMMTVFGDLDVSTLDELPPGRRPVATFHVETAQAQVGDAGVPVWQAVRREVAAGRQAFVVCPLVSSARREAASAVATAHELAEGALAGLAIGVVTGKQPAQERCRTLGAFQRGELGVLVATTVIEVGVDVPNATVMVVLGADRFGLAQLHQLRGRVGRGPFPAVCYLVGSPRTRAGQERLEALCATTDGFVLAEQDLQIRGAGQVLGAMQSGSTRDLKVADILRDTRLLEWAKADAAALVAEDPHLSRRPQLRCEVEAALGEQAAAWLTSA